MFLGWPSVVEAVGVWFPEGRRGFVMGVWNTHVSIGNIAGSAVAGAFVDTEWGLSFVVPGVIIMVMSIVIYFFLIPDPNHVDMAQPKSVTSKSADASCPDLSWESSANIDQTDNSSEHSLPALGIIGALRIPGVIEYSICLFFAKLVSYTFLFWLPFYINVITIDGKRYDNSQAADWAILFDVGGAFGGIVAGLITDFTACPAIVNVVMLFCAAPSLFLFKFHGTSNLKLFILYMVLSGFFVNGPYALITTAVSAKLGTHKCLHGNAKAMAIVTAIIDGTGSLGAAIGPLLAGVISSKGTWNDVFYMLIFADVVAAFILARQFWEEIKLKLQVRRIVVKSRSNSDSLNSETEHLISNST